MFPPSPESFDAANVPSEQELWLPSVSSVEAQVQASTTEVRLTLPLPACASTHIRKFGPDWDQTDIKDRQAGLEKRDREFAVGRYCAQKSLQRLTPKADVVDIPADVDRKPIWPEGIIGSISHSNHYAWAATAKLDAIKGIGVDTEITVDERTLRQVLKEITVEEELKFLKMIDADVCRAFTVVFSAKESIFKCLYPTNEKFFGFHDVQMIAANESTVTFAQNPTNPNFLTAPRNLTVQYAVFQNDVFTTIWI